MKEKYEDAVAVSVAFHAFLQYKPEKEASFQTHEKYERELAIANEKIRSLQNECKCVTGSQLFEFEALNYDSRLSLLLDAVDIAVPGQPTLMHYLQYDPVPLHFTTANGSIYPEVVAVPPPPADPADSGMAHLVAQANGANGHLVPEYST